MSGRTRASRLWRRDTSWRISLWDYGRETGVRGRYPIHGRRRGCETGAGRRSGGGRCAGVESHARAWRPKAISSKGSIRDFARSAVAIAVPAGAPRPGVETEQAVGRPCSTPHRICYSSGPSGDHLKALCEKWGVTNSVLGALSSRAARRSCGEPGRARRSRSRVSAIERTHRPTRHRHRRVPCRRRSRPSPSSRPACPASLPSLRPPTVSFRL